VPKELFSPKHAQPAGETFVPVLMCVLQHTL